MPKKLANKGLRVITGFGKSSCAFTAGLFLDLEPLHLRRERLGLSFQAKAESKGPSFAIYYALKAHSNRAVAVSPFKSISPNYMIRRRGLLMQRGEKVNLEAEWQPFREKAMQAEMLLFKIAYLFQGKDYVARLGFRRLFYMMSPKEQRNKLNWILGKITGAWKTCRHCDQAPRDTYVETCANSDPEPAVHEDRPPPKPGLSNAPAL
jgi:hypothetical protein